MSLEDDLGTLIRRLRVYAPLREGGTKGQKELEVLRDLLEGMERYGSPLYSEPRLSPLDPPDCIAQNASGDLAAFEITEFVSQEAVEINERYRSKVRSSWPRRLPVTGKVAVKAQATSARRFGSACILMTQLRSGASRIPRHHCRPLPRIAPFARPDGLLLC